MKYIVVSDYNLVDFNKITCASDGVKYDGSHLYILTPMGYLTDTTFTTTATTTANADTTHSFLAFIQAMEHKLVQNCRVVSAIVRTDTCAGADAGAGAGASAMNVNPENAYVFDQYNNLLVDTLPTGLCRLALKIDGITSDTVGPYDVQYVNWVVEQAKIAVTLSPDFALLDSVGNNEDDGMIVSFDELQKV